MKMPRAAYIGLLAAAVWLLCASGPRAQSFRSSSDIVPLFVTVTDGEGRLVGGLTREDFQIFDNGAPHPPPPVDSIPQPISLIALLDMSGSMADNLPLVRRACQDLLGHLGPADVAKLGMFGQTIAFSPTFTRDPEQLVSLLPKSIPATAPTPLWRAIDEAMNAVQPASSGRRVILVLSDGKDNGPEIGQRLVTPQNVRDRAEREDVMVYGIGLRSAPGPVAPGGIRTLADVLKSPAPDPTLGSLALGTGGGYVELHGREDIAETFTRIADELHRQYMLGFTPPLRDGKVHTVEVRVRNPGLRSQARKTYLAPR